MGYGTIVWDMGSSVGLVGYGTSVGLARDMGWTSVGLVSLAS